MKRINFTAVALSAAVLAFGALPSTTSFAKEKPTKGFNHKIPEQIMTPNKMETRIGDLNFGAVLDN